MQLKYGELSALQLCTYGAFADIASAVFGGKKDKVENTVNTGTLEGDVAAIKRMLSVGG